MGDPPAPTATTRRLPVAPRTVLRSPVMTAAEQVLPARAGSRCASAPATACASSTRTASQVVDLWAMAADDVLESMSMPHSRNPWYRLAPRPGDVLVTNLRRPILRLLEDSSPGVHDTLIPSCDSERYRQLGAPPDHGSCTDNFHGALRASASILPGPCRPP